MANFDKFGNPQEVIGLKDKNGSGYPRGFFTVGNRLFKVTSSPSNKDGVERWVTITEMKKNQGGRSSNGQQKRGF